MRLIGQHEATILKAAFTPSFQAMIDAAQASIDPQLPSLEAIIRTQSKPFTLAQLEWQITVLLIRVVYGGCFIVLLFKGLELVLKKDKNSDTFSSLMLLMPASLVCINFLSAVALASTTLATVFFLDIIIFLIAWSIANSVESIAINFSNAPALDNDLRLTGK